MFRLRLLLVILLSSPGVLRAEDDAAISNALNRDEIYVGQSVEYHVTVQNVESPKTPDLGKMDDFDVVSLGQPSVAQSVNITAINGVMRQIVRRNSEFHWRLTPRKAGTFQIAAPTLTVDGKTLSGRPLRLTVLPPDAQDLAILELSADRAAVYPTQPFTVTLSVWVKEVPPPHEDRDPLSVQRPAAALRIPWLVDQDLPGGLTPKEDWQSWIKRFIDQEGAGFAINNLVQQTAFSFFGGGESLVFRPPPKTVTRRDAQGHAARYRRYDFPRTFTAKQAGPVTLAAVTLQGAFATRAANAERVIGRDVYAASNALEINVKDVPSEERPAEYMGAIGHFQLETELTPRQLKVGDPMTFTLTVRGSGSLTGAKAPKLGEVPAVAARFKVYEATQKNDADAVRFVYSLRPLTAGNEPFPPVPVAYFDVDQEHFVTLLTDPIAITVDKSEQLSSEQIVAAPRAAGREAKELEARREGIFANITDPAAVADQSVRELHWLAGLGGCLGAYLAIAVTTAIVRRRSQDKSALRRRGAVGQARQRLRAAGGEWKAGRIREAADQIQDALAGLVADVADLHGAGLTPKDVMRQLREWALPDEVTQRTQRLLDTCDAARYGGLSASSGLDGEAQQVLESLITAMRNQRRFR